jgi:hypothetical protein
VPYAGDLAGLNPDSPDGRAAFDRFCRIADTYAEMGVTRLLLAPTPEPTLTAIAARLGDRYGTAGDFIGEKTLTPQLTEKIASSNGLLCWANPGRDGALLPPRVGVPVHPPAHIDR